MAGDGDFCEVPGHGRKYKLGKIQWCPHSDHNARPERTNVWRVLWSEEGVRKFKRFHSNPPTPAIAFAKELMRRQVAVEIISSKPFPPPKKMQAPDRAGLLWCPYCIKWREFQEVAIRDGDGLLGPALLRCIVCTMTVRDAYIRKYNPLFYARWETEQEARKRAIQAKKDAKSKQLTSVHRRRK